MGTSLVFENVDGIYQILTANEAGREVAPVSNEHILCGNASCKTTSLPEIAGDILVASGQEILIGRVLLNKRFNLSVKLPR